MIKSMTGYGMSKLDNEEVNLSVEIKTLNSKFLDTIVKLPKEFSDKELEVKNLLTDRLERGKANIVISFQRKDSSAVKMEVNKALFSTYLSTLKELAKENDTSENDLFKLALQMPEVLIQCELDEDLEEDWKLVIQNINQAIDQCDNFRKQEGKVLKEKLLGYIKNIGANLEDIEKQDPKRVEQVRERLSAKISELERVENVDDNRFEQELIYYIEKLDINEEKVRLKSHLNYFEEVINAETSQGKKLGFISQEIGREINTIGSKANDAVIQRQVVGMKEELEKIKEQLLNIL